MYETTLVISPIGIPSVIVTIVSILASAASIIASAANIGGTKIIEVLIFSDFKASATLLYTGLSRCLVPPFPGVTPQTTLVPYSIICSE